MYYVYSDYRSKRETYLTQLENLIIQLPVSNYTLLKHLCQFLYRVSIYQAENKMSIESLGIVFGPNVFRFTPENIGYREQNSINHIMSFLIEQSNHLFRMIAPSCENVVTPLSDLSNGGGGGGGGYSSQISRVPLVAAATTTSTTDAIIINDGDDEDVDDGDKKYKERYENETPDNMSEMNSYNDDDIDDEGGDEDVQTESLTTHSTTMAGTTMYPSMNRVTSTYCPGSRVGGGGIMTSTTGTKTTALPTTTTMTPSMKGLNTADDIPLKTKASNCDIISSYLEMAIRSCIEEHLFHERLSEWKVFNTTEKLDPSNYPVGFNHTLKPSCSDSITSQKINLTDEGDPPSFEFKHAKVLSGIDFSNESSDQIHQKLTQHLYILKSRVREFEKRFEHDYGRKATNSDKYSDPRINDIMCQISEVHAAMKYIKSSDKSSDQITNKSNPSVTSNNPIECTAYNGITNTKMTSSVYSLNHSPSKQSIYKTHDEVKDYMRELRSPSSYIPSKPSMELNAAAENGNPAAAAAAGQIESNTTGKPTVESTFLLLSNRLAEKRASANRPESLHLMNPKQIEAEKLALQKALLYFENLHGRPKEREDRITMRPLYDRYRSVKRLLASIQSNQNVNLPENTEENSDTDGYLSIPSNDDIVRRKSIQSPVILPNHHQHFDSNNHPMKSIHQSTTTVGTVGLSRRNQASGDNDYYTTTNTSSSQNKLPNEMYPRIQQENGFSSSGGVAAVTTAYGGGPTRRSSTNTNEYSSPMHNHHQDNFTGSTPAVPYDSPPLSLSSLSNPRINQVSSNIDLLRPNNSNVSVASVKNRRRILTNSDNAINSMPSSTTATTTDKYVESSQTMPSSDLSSWSINDLKAALRNLRESKRQLQKTLKDFEHEFTQTTGQKVERADRLRMRPQYCQYKALKTRLLQLETELKGRCA
ncbi:unnamed protein product [Trichobilharzia szidati]|nr:unnamed protein product [Trichobilharzia szidati]